MDLKNILSTSDKKDAPELYWTLIIEPGWVQAGIWRIVDDKAQVMVTSSPSAWELDSELVQTADVALSQCAQDLPDDVKEPEKTVFGVVSSWVDEGEIKERYLEKIKKICSDLSLTPAGFVVLSEAVSHLTKTKEGGPLSGVVLGIYNEDIDVSVFRLGNLSGNTSVSRSVSVVDDVTEGLTRLSDGSPFPSRFLLYNGKESELEDARQALIKADWESSGKVKLLHTPKIEIIDPKEKVYAVSLAGASEIADVNTIDVVKLDDEVEEAVEDEELENVTTSAKDVTAQELGFVLGKDVVDEKPRPEEQVSEQEKEKVEDEKQEGPEQLEDMEEEVEFQQEEKLPAKKKKLPMPNFSSMFSSLFSKMPKFKKRQSEASRLPKTGNKLLVTGVTIFLLLIVGGFLAWWFLPKADVVIYVTTKRLDEKVTLTVDPEVSSADFDQGILPGTVQTVSVDGSKTTSTTGTKTVGEKAKGEVVFYRAGSQIILKAGTEIKGPNNLKFELDNEVTVASGSASTPGTATASVTAADIGAQYNLASGTSFSVANYSTGDIEAKNESSFSGGTSREISAVSQEDRDDLETELTDELKNKALSQIQDNLDSNLILIEKSLSSTVSSEDFSAKVGDEADTLKLTLTLDMSAVAVDKSALNEMSVNLLHDQVPDGFVLKEDQIDVNFDFDSEEDGKYLVDASITANLLPTTNPDEIAQKIAGKYPPIAQKYLNEEVPGFVRAEIIFKPKLPGKLGTLPRLAKNIQVEVAAER